MAQVFGEAFIGSSQIVGSVIVVVLFACIVQHFIIDKFDWKKGVKNKNGINTKRDS